MADEQTPADFDNNVFADGKEYGLKAVKLNNTEPDLSTAVMVTEIETKKQFILRPTAHEDGTVVDASINLMNGGWLLPLAVKPSDLPAELRNAMAGDFAEALGQSATPVAEEVLDNLREGNASLKAPPRAEREENAAFKRIMKNTDLDAEIAENVANNRVDTLLERLNTAMEAGDKDAQESLKAQLKAATSEQPELDEAAAMLGKPKEPFKRAEFEGKHGGNAIDGEMTENSHVARLKAQREAEATREADGPAV